MATSTSDTDQARIHPETALGAVKLTVSDIGSSQMFYERALGLTTTELDDGGLALGVAGEPPLVELRGDRAAPRLNRRATGLYHLAVLVPSRRDLAWALKRLADERWPLDGASDHLVSEALYLSDPDGNGIEIYRDRPRGDWPFENGQLQMATNALDLRGVLGELEGAGEPQRQAPPGTTIGHVHLQVAELERSEAFYNGVLGFDVMVRRYPGALFVSAGGYHHHIGMNTWHSADSAPPAPGAVGLRSFDVELPNAEELERVLARVRDAGIETAVAADGATLLRDPSGNPVQLKSR
jgi:catechol 2,3-dioxygenase